MEMNTSIYELVRERLAFQFNGETIEIDYTPDAAAVERYVGSLRVAGFSDSLKTDSEIKSAMVVVDRLLKRSGKVRTAATSVATPENSNDTFMNIEALIEKGSCPRCKTSMVPVKLSMYKKPSGYLTANYCTECRTCVWQRKN